MRSGAVDDRHALVSARPVSRPGGSRQTTERLGQRVQRRAMAAAATDGGSVDRERRENRTHAAPHAPVTRQRFRNATAAVAFQTIVDQAPVSNGGAKPERRARRLHLAWTSVP